MENLVGQTVSISPQDRRNGGNITRTLKIINEYDIDGRRMYLVQDVETREKFPADAVRYDQLFLVSKKEIGPKNAKAVLLPPNHPDYKLK